jgi:hypothetical protein
MKKILPIFLLFIGFTFSCDVAPKNNNPDYEVNLATAKKYFELFGSEDLEAQKPLICPGVTHYGPFYGSQPGGYDGIIANNKAWQDGFEDITFSDSMWLPGTDSLGLFDGSVRTYGTWNAKNTQTGNVVKLNAYHSFDFNGAGQIHIARDYFDATGVMAAAMKIAEE